MDLDGLIEEFNAVGTKMHVEIVNGIKLDIIYSTCCVTKEVMDELFIRYVGDEFPDPRSMYENGWYKTNAHIKTSD